MDFVFDKIESTNCSRCGGLVDVSQLTAFKQLPCPHCQAPVRVPGKLGTLLLQEEIGRGAAGIVYKTLDMTLNRHVAVKLLKNDGNADSQKIVEATVAEARALAAMNHPNVVHIHTIGMRHNQPYIVMELLVGSEKLNLMLKEGWVADEKRGLEIGIDIAHGLRAAQAAGLLHRDVKPGNILFNGEGVAKLLDFSVIHAAGGNGVTVGENEKVVIGTPYYIAPEAARGLEVDFRADLYSLGATLFHLMTGQPVFDGESSRDVMRARLKQRAPDIRSLAPHITAGTAAVMARMLATSPDERHGSYDELIADMKAALADLLSGHVEPVDSDELDELNSALSGGAMMHEPDVPIAMPRRQRTGTTGSARQAKKSGPSPVMIGIAAVVGLLVVGGIILALSGGSGGDAKDGSLAANVDPSRRRVEPVTPAPDPDPEPVTPTTTDPVTPGPTPGTPAKPDPDPADKSDKTDNTKTPPKTPEKTPEKTPDPPKPPVTPPVPPQPPVTPPTPPVTPPVVPKPPVAADPLDADYAAWVTRTTAQLKRQPTQWKVMAVNGLGTFKGATLTPAPDGTVTVSGTNDAVEVYAVESSTLGLKHSAITAIRIEALPDASLPSGGPGRSPSGNFVLSHITAMIRPLSEPNPQLTPGNTYVFDHADAEFSQDKFPVTHAIDNNPQQTGWATAPRLGQPNAAMFRIKSAPANADEAGVILRVMLHHQSPNPQHSLGKFRVSMTTDADPFLPLNLPKYIETILAAAARTPAQETELRAYYRRVKVEGMEYIPPGGVASAVPPKGAGPPPPRLEPYTGTELAKLGNVAKIYEGEADDIVLVPRHSAWHYYAEPKSVPAHWQATDFYATGWKLGEAALGFGFPDLRTDLRTTMRGNFTAVYMRAPFTITDPAKIGELTLQGRFDDAVVVYINGHEVHRTTNITGTGDDAKIDSPSQRVPLVVFELKDAKKHLKAGLNVVAIEVHNINANDVDFIADPALVATPAPQPRQAIANNRIQNWLAVGGKLYNDNTGLIIDGEEGTPRFSITTNLKTDFDGRSSNIRVHVRMKVQNSAQIKLDVLSNPSGTKTVPDDNTQVVPASTRFREVIFRVKVTGKLTSLALTLPKGETVIESIRVVQERDSKVSDSWDFKK